MIFHMTKTRTWDFSLQICKHSFSFGLYWILILESFSKFGRARNDVFLFMTIYNIFLESTKGPQLWHATSQHQFKFPIRFSYLNSRIYYFGINWKVKELHVSRDWFRWWEKDSLTQFMYAGGINLTHVYIQVKSLRLEEKGKKKKNISRCKNLLHKKMKTIVVNSKLNCNFCTGKDHFM